jgi:transglutaminase-like putative cysteine protease
LQENISTAWVTSTVVGVSTAKLPLFMKTQSIVTEFFTLFLGLVLVSSTAFATLSPVQQKAVAWVNKTPATAKSSPEALASYLSKVSADEYTRALTIYTWIAKNIRYDWDSYRAKAIPPQEAKNVLKWGMGVCQGYAELFQELCKGVGLRSELVSGYAKGYLWQLAAHRRVLGRAKRS